MSRSIDSDNMAEVGRQDSVLSDPESHDARINILLVDDEPRNLTVLETVLNEPDYRLVRAESADEALLALVREEFALIILDIQMPEMTGFELAQMVKQRKKTAGVPIIFLTAYYSDFEHVLEGYGSGAVDYLHKPVNATILRSKVAVFAMLYRTARQTESTNNALVAQIAERRHVEEQLLQLNNELESRVEQRTAELLHANAAMRENEELLRLAQEAGQVGIWIWDLQTQTGQWTRAAWEIYMPSGGSGHVTISQWLSCLHPDDRTQALASIESAKQSGVYWDELRIERPDGSTKWVELVGAVEYCDGQPVRMRGAVRDTTQRKELELELRDAHRRKDEFLATLAHELRNPLAPIRNSLEILKLTPQDRPTVHEVAGMMERQVHHLVRLVDDLLDVSRVIGGKIELRRETVELSYVLRGAVETTSALMKEKGHTLTVSLPEESILVNADPVRLTQIVGNLLTNAAKYTEANGCIWLCGEREGDEVVVKIRDNGIGISSDMLSRIFDLFVQADQATTRAQGGLGIGLTLVKNLVEMHSGLVAARSEGLGKGSEFQVRLPVLIPGVHDSIVALPVERSTSRMTRHRLLIVDDNRDAAVSLAILLRLKGHDVQIAHDGPTALDLAVSYQPEAVFLDLGMPGMDGFEVATRVRQIPGMEHAILAALTGWGQQEDRRRTATAGFNHHFVKPAESQELDSLLAALDGDRTT
jgi:PAS domain S-box-containing protein